MTLPAALALLLAAAPAAARAPLGATYAGWSGGFAGAPARLAALKSAGFRQVVLVPSYPYTGKDEIDFAKGPAPAALEKTVALALDGGFAVVLKPHLDPPAFFPGYGPRAPERRSWRFDCPWRGYFDLDPAAPAYRDGIVGAELALLARVLASRPSAPPVRLDLGAELMTSTAQRPERWVELLAFAKKERRRLGLEGRVLFAHDFEHHFEIAGDVVARLDAARRRALGRYVAGLDAVALSQYMDLTAAMPKAERDVRLPTADEVAKALVLHERDFREDILKKALGLKDSEIPPLHLDEFGVGRGGLRRPNAWAGETTSDEEKALDAEIARGHEGLALYLAREDGRRALSASLWTVGRHYDVFGWDDPRDAIPAAADADRAYLSGR